MLKFKQWNGFTIIEILVVISIMGILLAISIPNFRSYERNAKVRHAARDLRSLFWDAQSFSLAPEDVNITSYKISLTKGQGSASPVVLNRIIGGSASMVRNMTFDKDVSIDNILLGNTNQNPITVDFLTGNRLGEENKEGEMVFTPTSSAKLTIRLKSSKSLLKFDVILDPVTNTITWGKTP